MKLENLFLMSWQNLKRNKRRLSISSLGVIIGIATLIFFLSLTNGARELIFEHFLKRLPANQIKLNPRYESSAGSMILQALRDPDNLSAGVEKKEYRIDQDLVDRIAALEGVQTVHGLNSIDATCYLYAPAPPPNDSTSTRIGIASFDFDYMADALPEGVDWHWSEEDETVPLLISPQLLIAWNETFAPTFEDLPNLDEETIKIVPLFLRVVKEEPVREVFQYQLKIVGMSPKVPIFTPLVPEEFVATINRAVHGEDYTPSFSSLIVTMENPSYVGPLMKQFEEMGLKTGAEERVARMIDMGINVLTLFLGAISLIIVFISLVNTVNIFLINVMERRYEIGVMRAVGASRGNIRHLIFLESALVGLVNGLVGALAGIGAILLVDPFLQPLIGRFVVGQASVFAISPLLILAVIVASPLVNVIAVFQPANYAARLDPVDALRR